MKIGQNDYDHYSANTDSRHQDCYLLIYFMVAVIWMTYFSSWKSLIKLAVVTHGTPTEQCTECAGRGYTLYKLYYPIITYIRKGLSKNIYEHWAIQLATMVPDLGLWNDPARFKGFN